MKSYLIRLCMLACLWTTLWVSIGVAQESPCTAGIAPQLVVGEKGVVTAGSANNVRTEPSTSAELVFRMEAGTQFQILDGPSCGEGYNWWKVSTGNQTGWTVEGNAGGYFLVPVTEDVQVATTTPVATSTAECSLEPRLIVGRMARISTSTPSRLRDKAGLEGVQIGQLQPGDGFQVKQGPLCLDGINWWQILAGDLSGWTAEGIDEEYFLELIPLIPTSTPPFEALPTAYAIDWSVDGTYIAVGTAEGVHIFRSADWTAPAWQWMRDYRITSVAFDPQNPTHLAISASQGDTLALQIIDAKTGKSQIILSKQQRGYHHDLQFSSDGSLLATETDGNFIAYESKSGKIDYSVLPLDIGDGSLEFRGFDASAFSLDGQWIAGSYPTSSASIVYVGEYGSTKNELILIESTRIEELITNIAFSRNADRFVVGGSNGNLRMWTLPDFEYHSFIRGERSTTSNRVNDIAFSPTDPVFATAEGNPQGVVRLFNANTLQQIQAKIVPGTSGTVVALAYHPDGSQIAVLIDNSVMILDSETLEPLARLTGGR